MTPMTTRFIVLFPLVGLIVALAIGSIAVPSYGSVTDNQREGRQILRSIDDGDRRCANLSETDLERVGEYVMGRMAGSTRAHEQMNQLMGNMMGARGEQQMHEFMGRRFTGCGGGRLPVGFGAMMGSMGMMAGGDMMGNRPGTQSHGYGSMMGRAPSGDGDDDWDGGPAAIVMIVLMAGLLAVVAALLFRGSSRRSAARSPLDMLNDRFARGEIDTDDYEQRRRALGGGS